MQEQRKQENSSLHYNESIKRQDVANENVENT